MHELTFQSRRSRYSVDAFPVLVAGPFTVKTKFLRFVRLSFGLDQDIMGSWVRWQPPRCWRWLTGKSCRSPPGLEDAQTPEIESYLAMLRPREDGLRRA